MSFKVDIEHHTSEVDVATQVLSMMQDIPLEENMAIEFNIEEVHIICQQVIMA